MATAKPLYTNFTSLMDIPPSVPTAPETQTKAMDHMDFVRQLARKLRNGPPLEVWHRYMPVALRKKFVGITMEQHTTSKSEMLVDTSYATWAYNDVPVATCMLGAPVTLSRSDQEKVIENEVLKMMFPAYKYAMEDERFGDVNMAMVRVCFKIESYATHGVGMPMGVRILYRMEFVGPTEIQSMVNGMGYNL